MNDLTALVAGAVQSTPASNTGVTVAWMGLHWFAGTVFGWSAEAVACRVAEAFKVKPVALPRGGLGYERSYIVAGSARVYWSPGRADVHVSLPGEACERLALVDLVEMALEMGLEPNSRLDVAWDITGLTPGTFEDAFRAGDVVTRIHREVNPETGRLRGVERRSNHQGDTVYLGSRSSERFVRIYDRRGPTRLEMEWKGKRALALWHALLAVPEDQLSRTAFAELRAFLDFRDRSASVRPDSCPLLDWWAVVVDGAGRSSVVISREARTLENVREWVVRQVAPSLAMLHDAARGAGDWTAFVLGALWDGRERYQRRPECLALVASA